MTDTAADAIQVPSKRETEAPVPWARQRCGSVERTTARKRQEVPTLPTWDPLPPGESVVRRPRSSAV